VAGGQLDPRVAAHRKRKIGSGEREEEKMAIELVRKVDDSVEIQRVIVSVSDKKDLETFVPGLLEANPQIHLYSTGGTYDAVKTIPGIMPDVNLTRISDYTGQPEMHGGLVKTLDFRLYLGLLSENYNPHHREDLVRAKAITFDMVVVNLYPFEEVAAANGSSAEDSRANIDIGGPCMIRAAAKNFHRVAVVTDPTDYPMVLAELKKQHGKLSLQTRFRLAQKAFRHTASYDEAIRDYFDACSYEEMAKTYETI
jgi:phosphoribosylaminoimidazolecarboxamide formyltransferase/IMP cyclohydrolase